MNNPDHIYKNVFIGVSSNIDPVENINKAFELLHEKIKITQYSTFYETEPLKNRTEQQKYINGVIQVESTYNPRDLKYNILRKIETKLKRVRTKDKYASRTIDLDILIFEDLIINTKELQIPDPDILERPFLSVPLYELQPDINIVFEEQQISLESIIAQNNFCELKAVEIFQQS